jgi:hypothetical protein
MDANEYQTTTAKLDSPTEENLKELARWAEQEALPWLRSELAEILQERRVVPLNPRDAIRQGLQTTFADREKLPKSPRFYVAQMTMLDAELKRYCKAASQLADTSERFASNATVYALHVPVRACMHEGIIMLEQASAQLRNRPGAYGAWRREIEHPFEIFKGAEQFIYGRFSGLTHDDPAPFAPIATLRTAIEFRIRSAFGIQGYVDPLNDNFIPIDLGQVFDRVGEHLAEIEFVVDFHDIVKVYRWSNFYLHGGWRDFVWVPGFALQFLRPLFADPRNTPTGGWNIDGGIRMPREVWRAIRKSFEPSTSHGLLSELFASFSSALQRRKKNRRLVLNPAAEQQAACAFTD